MKEIIKDLKYKVHLLNEQSQNNYEKYVQVLKDNNLLNEQINQLEQENQQLKQQLAITEKALELACERVKYFEEMQDKEMGFYDFFGYESNYDLVAIIKQYKQQAKEMLQNENIC